MLIHDFQLNYRCGHLHVQFEEQDSSLVNEIKRAKYHFEENESIYD
jgi:hypothetical protein